MLLINGADRNLLAKNGFTPLHVAVENARINMVKFLLGQPLDDSDTSSNDDRGTSSNGDHDTVSNFFVTFFFQ